MGKFIAHDWAGNVLFNGKTFDSFEDGWGHVYEHIPDEEDWQDIYVVEAETREARYLDPNDQRPKLKVKE